MIQRPGAPTSCTSTALAVTTPRLSKLLKHSNKTSNIHTVTSATVEFFQAKIKWLPPTETWPPPPPSPPLHLHPLTNLRVEHSDFRILTQQPSRAFLYSTFLLAEVTKTTPVHLCPLRRRLKFSIFAHIHAPPVATATLLYSDQNSSLKLNQGSWTPANFHRLN